MSRPFGAPRTALRTAPSARSASRPVPGGAWSHGCNSSSRRWAVVPEQTRVRGCWWTGPDGRRSPRGSAPRLRRGCDGPATRCRAEPRGPGTLDPHGGTFHGPPAAPSSAALPGGSVSGRTQQQDPAAGPSSRTQGQNSAAGRWQRGASPLLLRHLCPSLPPEMGPVGPSEGPWPLRYSPSEARDFIPAPRRRSPRPPRSEGDSTDGASPLEDPMRRLSAGIRGHSYKHYSHGNCHRSKGRDHQGVREGGR